MGLPATESTESTKGKLYHIRMKVNQLTEISDMQPLQQLHHSIGVKSNSWLGAKPGQEVIIILNQEHISLYFQML